MNAFAHALSAALQYAIVSRQVADDDLAIGFVYREDPTFERDSGWRVFSGAEDDEFTDNPDNFITQPFNEILENNPEIKPLLNQSFGAWEWNDDENSFTPVTDWQPKGQ